jgi:hypothetical protein
MTQCIQSNSFAEHCKTVCSTRVSSNVFMLLRNDFGNCFPHFISYNYHQFIQFVWWQLPFYKSIGLDEAVISWFNIIIAFALGNLCLNGWVAEHGGIPFRIRTPCAPVLAKLLWLPPSSSALSWMVSRWVCAESTGNDPTFGATGRKFVHLQ